MLTRSGGELLLKRSSFKRGPSGPGVHWGSGDRGLGGGHQADSSETCILSGYCCGPQAAGEKWVRLDRSTGKWFSEPKVNREELAAAWTCQPGRPGHRRHVTEPSETTAKLPEQLTRRACQEARCCSWKRVFPGWASGFSAFHLKRRGEERRGGKGRAVPAFS